MKKLSDDKLDKVRKSIDYSEYFNKKIYPQMEDYYRGQKIDFVANTGKCLCPFHNEDDGSFHIRTWNDGVTTFKCFGCNVGGDIVKLHILYAKAFEDREIRYGEAAQELYDEFIEGRILRNVSVGAKIRLKSDENTQLNNIIDLTNFTMTLDRYEKFLCSNKTIDVDTKTEYYKLADKLEYLVLHNMISAKEACGVLKTAYEKAVELERKLKEER